MTLLQMVVRAAKLGVQGYVRKARINAKALWLAFRVWRHKLEIRALTAKIKAEAEAKGYGSSTQI